MNAGIVTVVGKPNAGKSTLLNRIVGQKLSITSPKPQSTRNRVVGIHTRGDIQMVILDTPGLLDPKYELQTVMRKTALRAIDDADVILYLADATMGVPASLDSIIGPERRPRAPIITVFNKADLLSPAGRDRLAAALTEGLFVSATTGEGVEELLAAAARHLPESPFLYPEGDLSTQSMRFFAAEMLRETALEQLEQEVPYSVACEIEEFRESQSPVYIRAVIYVERESQKRIVIGSKGTTLREIGKAARMKLEQLVESPVYLDLWVKVLPNWRRQRGALSRLGYHIEGENR